MGFFKGFMLSVFYQALLTLAPIFFISDFIVWPNIIKNELISARFIKPLLKTYGYIYFAIYAVLLVFFRHESLDMNEPGFAQFPSVVGSSIIFGLFMSYELARLGLSPIIESLQEVIKKIKSPQDLISKE